VEGRRAVMRSRPSGEEAYPRSRSRSASNSSARPLAWASKVGGIGIHVTGLALLESAHVGTWRLRRLTSLMAFPTTRLRRLRQTEPLRSMVAETRLSPEAFVYPLFVCPGEGVRKEVRSMPGVFNLSVDEAVKEARETYALGIPAVILFGLPENKDEVATGAWAEDGMVQQAARALKREVPGLVLVGDVCLCEYMSHGHCGIVGSTPQSLGAAVAAPPAAAAYEIVNDATLELLARTSVSLARAGIDIIAPSDMMDGRVAAIRQALDAAGQQNTPILSYAAKFASGFYGPFREAADSAPQFGDRRSYQMDGANLREACLLYTSRCV